MTRALTPEPYEAPLPVLMPVELSGVADLWAALPPELQDAIEAAESFERNHRAGSTRKGYAQSWRTFTAWCDSYGLVSLPAEPSVVAIYIGHLATTGGRTDSDGNELGRTASTVVQNVSAIRAYHKDHGQADPTKDPYVQRVLRGLKRTKGTRKTRREPMTLTRLRTVITSIRNARMVILVDRVLIAADSSGDGCLTAARLARLDWQDISFTRNEVTLSLLATNNSQIRKLVTVQGRVDGLCLVSALRALASAVTERLDELETVHSGSAPYASWRSVFGTPALGVPTSGPLLPRLDRHGNLLSGTPSRASLATRLSRASIAVGVPCGRQARPVWSDGLRLEALDKISRPHLADIRDETLLLLGFALAARRSNLSMLCVGEVIPKPEGLIVRFRRCKTDQDGEGRDIAVPRKGGPLCPVAAWERWLEALEGSLGFKPEPTYPAFPALDNSGTRVEGSRAVFDEGADRLHDSPSHWEGISGDEINAIVKRRAHAAGLRTDHETGVVLNWGGHSLRRGWMTEAARQGISLEQMMAHSGHVTTEVALEYIAEARKFDPQHSAAMRLAFDLPADSRVSDSGRSIGSKIAMQLPDNPS